MLKKVNNFPGLIYKQCHEAYDRMNLREREDRNRRNNPSNPSSPDSPDLPLDRPGGVSTEGVDKEHPMSVIDPQLAACTFSLSHTLFLYELYIHIYIYIFIKSTLCINI